MARRGDLHSVVLLHLDHYPNDLPATLIIPLRLRGSQSLAARDRRCNLNLGAAYHAANRLPKFYAAGAGRLVDTSP